MPPANIDTVEHLVQALLTTMEQESMAIGASAEDVISACFTLTLRTVKATKEMNCDMRDVRDAISRLMLECSPDKVVVIQ